MASVFGHFAAAAALGAGLFPKQTRTATVLLAGACACVPDLDVLAFRFDIPYHSEWGHRGWTHSLLFAAVFGWSAAWAFFRRMEDFQRIALWCMLSVASHPLLDMLTNGGKGVALFFPVDNSRLFFPFRPIQVSPLGVSRFFSSWGLEVLASEMLWIGLPCLGLIAISRMSKHLRREV